VASSLLDLVGRSITSYRELPNLGAVPGIVVMADSPSQVLQIHPFSEIFSTLAGTLA